MTSHRGKLLVDLCTGRVTIEKPEEGSSDIFISNAYDPSRNKHPTQGYSSHPQESCSMEFINSSSTLLPEIQPNPNNTTIVCSPTESDIMSIDLPLPHLELNNEDSNILPSIQPSSTSIQHSPEQIDILSHNASQFNMDEKKQTSTSVRQIERSENNRYLDETTGLFVTKVNFVDTQTQRSVSDFILDETTGEMIELDNNVNESDENFDMDIFDKKKDRAFNKDQRVKGKLYVGRKIEKSQDDKQHTNFVAKLEKSKKAKLCSHNAREAKTPRTFLCATIGEEQRDNIFKYFWSLDSWVAKKAYIKNLVRMRPIVRRRKSSTSQQLAKHMGFDCFLPNDKNELVKVCKDFLLKTIDMNNETLSEWVKSINEKPAPNENIVTKSNKKSKAPVTIKSDNVKEWLSLLPKVPSHYCRASTSRKYVEDTFRNKSHMFTEYQQWCSSKKVPAAQRKLFCSVLKNEKISIYKPRKDQCDTCTAYKEGNSTPEEYEYHIQMKQEAYLAKESALSMCSSDVLVVTMDVQSVLLSPKLQVSVQYYKQKLQVHNFTLFVNNDKEVHLYVWHEGDGGVTANEFTTCLIDFLNTKIDQNYKKLILISDGCGYQNRNKILASALAQLTKEKSIEIQQIILEKGHTMMEVDSVHSTLERLFKPPIYSPNDYLNLMGQARPSQPYTIHHLDYTFFKNYENICQLESLRPGKKTGDPVVTDIRGLLYNNGQIYFKLRQPHEWQLLPQRLRAAGDNLVSLYEEPRKIEKSKFESLQSLKKYMHRDYHYFYDGLQHN